MQRTLKILGGGVGVAVLGVAALFVGARFADGPLEIIAGGPFTSGDVHSGAEPDWAFLKDRPTVEFQLFEPAQSRTTFVLVHDGRLFIPSGYMNTWYGRLWKHWPYHAEQDARARLRVDGQIYERTLVRLTEGPELEPILAELSRKYAGGAAIGPGVVDSGDLWLFELAPRQGG